MSMVIIDAMTRDDIPNVLVIEELAFATPWSSDAFYSEIDRNSSARYIAARSDNMVVGYGGMWVIVDEGHITNIAVHPDYRGRHIGDMIVEGLINTARGEGVGSLTLEVRRTNYIAQNLYKKYGFEVAGIRPGYYADNGEDALIMWKRGL